MSYLVVLGFVVGSCVTVFCILTYCKSRILKSTESMNNGNTWTTGRRRNPGIPRPSATTTIFVVPTTSQVMEMYNTQATVRNDDEVSPKRPPSYGTIDADVPPTYEQAVERLDNTPK